MKSKKNLANSSQSTQNKLDWLNFNFLENLLIFCVESSKSVPQESGVCFRISNPKDNSLCILFQIDRQHDPLIKQSDGKRPDYMCLYIDHTSCICTIIEMKGTNKNSLDHGIDQILALRDRLKDEIKDHLPANFKVKFQGILLTPHNAQINLQTIAQESSKNNLTILPLQYNQKAELYPYISKLNKLTERYQHKQLSQCTSLLIEEILTKKASPKRLTERGDEIGIHIDYLLSNDKDYITLVSNQNHIEILMGVNNEDIEKIKRELDLLKASNPALASLRYSQKD